MSAPFYEEGYYLCEVTQQALAKAKTGTPQFVLRFRVISFSGGSSVPKQYERTCYRSITEKTMPYFRKDLDSLGFQGSSLRELEQPIFVGQRVEMRCQHEGGQDGEPREKWDIAMQQGSSTIEGDPLDSASYRRLDALFGANSKTATPVTARPAAVTQRSNNQEITDEDIPF